MFVRGHSFPWFCPGSNGGGLQKVCLELEKGSQNAKLLDCPRLIEYARQLR